MTLPQWINVALTMLVVLAGTAVNLFIIGRFVGQWGEAMKNIARTLEKVEQRVEAVEDQAAALDGQQGLFNARLVNSEAAAEQFWQYRDAFTKLSTTVELVGKSQQDKLDAVGRSIGVIERQLGNLVTTKAGFTTLTSEDQN